MEAPAPSQIESTPKSPGFKVDVDARGFSSAIYAGARGVSERGTFPSALKIGAPIGVGGVVKEIVPIAGIFPSSVVEPGKEGQTGNFGYNAEAIVRFEEPTWVDSDALAKLLTGQGKFGVTALKDADGGAVLAILNGDQGYQLWLGYKDAAAAKQAITERGEAALLKEGEPAYDERRWIDQLEKILKGEDPQPNSSIMLESKAKFVYDGPKSESEIASGNGGNPSDMEQNVSGFAECLEAVVNGLNAVKGGQPIGKTITLEPPVFFEQKLLEPKPLAQAA